MYESDELRLVFPEEQHKTAALEYRDEFIRNGETVINGSGWLDGIRNYTDWLAHVRRNKNRSKPDERWVPATTFFAVRNFDERIVGMIDVRHTLKDEMKKYGGNIGYSVRPSERNKGYANRMLGLGLRFVKELGLSSVILTCDKNNPASWKVIQNWGGIMVQEYLHESGIMVQVYRIDV